MNMKDSIVNSMLWSAYGDAMGFITELSDKKTLKYRTSGLSRITKLIPWTRKLGGRYGISVELPEGCYSDDTQMRLAVCRSIRIDGSFDCETFSKIEIPVFLSYALGMGIGTKAAGESLIKKSVQWNTNFFNTKRSNYVNGGGNGAAMRIQPHVWVAPPRKTNSEIVLEIMRNAIITHGHPIGWVGAVFHGLVLREAMLCKECPTPAKWLNLANVTSLIIEVCNNDPQIRDIWIPYWENTVGENFKNSVSLTVDNLQKDIKIVLQTISNLKNEILDIESQYSRIVESIDAFNPSVRGSATKTALLATYVAYAFSKTPDKGIEICINTLGSDTDTIGTMAGAIIGSFTKNPPPQKVLDNSYLVDQAKRLSDIGEGISHNQNKYPDLLTWSPPKTPLDSVRFLEEETVLYGFGPIYEIGNKIEHLRGNQFKIWQFYKTHFGQTLLLRHREQLDTISPHFVGFSTNKYVEASPNIDNSNVEGQLNPENKTTVSKKSPLKKKICPANIDEITDFIIKNNFNEKDIGKYLLSYANDKNGIEKAIAFSSIIVKAKRARLNKG